MKSTQFLRFDISGLMIGSIQGRVTSWLATYARKTKVPGSSTAASYMLK